MSWIIIAIIGYFFLAIVNVNDKVFLENTIKDSRVFTVFIGFLGLLVLVLAPLGFSVPSQVGIMLNLLAGVLLTLALLTFFSSLKVGQASWVIPLIGAGIPLVTMVIERVFLGETFETNEMIAFFLLIVGGVMLTMDRRNKFRLNKGTWLALLAALFFGLSFGLSKYIYDTQGFISGFIWIRFGTFLGALCLLLHKQVRNNLRTTLHEVSRKQISLFAGNQAVGAIGFVLQNVAFSLGSVTLVNALQGVQYVFVALLVVLFSKKFPHLLQEKITRRMMVEKGIAVGLICAGLAMLAF